MSKEDQPADKQELIEQLDRLANGKISVEEPVNEDYIKRINSLASDLNLESLINWEDSDL